MTGEESAYPMDWLNIAERGLGRVGRCLGDDDPEAAGFFLQQALEKFLKAFLLYQGCLLRRIHDLEALLDDTLEYDSDMDKFRSLCRQVSGYYLVERYPLVGIAGASGAEIVNALETAQELVTKIREAISG
jgi:HEPN domain-containing protein